MIPIFRRAGLAIVLASCLAVSGAAAAEHSAVVVIDHSGSMWRQIDGTAKITVVRDMLGSLFDEYEGKLDLGVLAFGGGKSGSCKDVGVLKPVGAINTAQYNKALASRKPKGSAALGASLTSAAKMFSGSSGAQSVILVTDSTDECKADPCAAARALKKKSPQTIVHVIAFDAQAREKLQDLSCVAEETDGLFAATANEGQFEVALRRAFQAAAAGISGGQAGPAGAGFGAVPGGVGTPGGSPATSDDPGILSLTAILARGAQPLGTGVLWRIYDGRAMDDGSYKLLQTNRDARPVLSLTPGDYLINASYGRAHVTKRVTVWPAKRLDDTFNLNAGGLRLYATLAKQPLLSEQGLTFDVYSEETDQYGNHRKIISNAKPGIVIRLNSGSYRVHSRYGDSNAIIEADVTVEPGKVTEATIDHQAGRITFKLVQKAGGEALADTTWNISTNEGALVKRSGGAFPSHVLAAGSYKVKVEHAGREYQAAFSVSAGDKKVVEVVMP